MMIIEKVLSKKTRHTSSKKQLVNKKLVNVIENIHIVMQKQQYRLIL